MLELWILLGVAVWVALMTLVVALCAAAGGADRDLMTLRRRRRRSGRLSPLTRA